MRVAIVANPVSGRGRAFHRLQLCLKSFSDNDCDVRFLATRCPGHAGDIAGSLLADCPDLLVVCGGDGTLKEVVTKIPDPPFPVALIPGGTANVIAREMGIPLDPAAAWRVALGRSVRRIDLGTLRAGTTHHFLMSVGIGFDAYVAAHVRPALKQKIGIAAYYLATFQCLAKYPFPEFTVTTPEGSLPASSCIIANARRYGGGLVLAPRANVTDGVLDIVTVQGARRIEYFKFMFSAWRGKPVSYPWIQHRRAAQVQIDGGHGLWVQADGEIIGSPPIQVGVSRRAFPLVVPRECADNPAAGK